MYSLRRKAMNNTLLRKLEKYAHQARQDALFDCRGHPATVAQRTQAKIVQHRAEQAIMMLAHGAPDTEVWAYFIQVQD
jgi:hypothetical protein